MKRQYSLTALALLSAALGALPTSGQRCPCPPGKSAATKPSPLDVTSNWPSGPRKAAAAYTQKYGRPDEASSRMVAWNDRGDFSRIAIYRTSAIDPDPTPHPTFIEHTVRYTVPAFRVGDLKNFNKSLVIDSKNGTLASRGDDEKSNILALNLADEIVTGKRPVADAQQMRSKTEMLSQAGKSSSLTDKLQFKVDQAGKPHQVRATPQYPTSAYPAY